MSNIEENYQNLLSIIQKSQDENKAQKQTPRIIAVSKRRTLAEINHAYDCGLRDFGENYLQEAIKKIDSFQHSVNWHFIGSIQSNKTKQIQLSCSPGKRENQKTKREKATVRDSDFHSAH